MRERQSIRKEGKGKRRHVMADEDRKTTLYVKLTEAFRQVVHQGTHSINLLGISQRSDLTNNPNPILRSSANGRQLKGENSMKNKTPRTKEHAVNKEKGGFEQLELFPGWETSMMNMEESEQEGSSKEQEKEEEAEIAALGQLPLKNRVEAERRLSYVKGVNGRKAMQVRMSLRSNIESVAKTINDKYPPSPRTVSHWRQRFTASGENVHALAPLLNMRGNRGRKISDETIRIINHIIQQEFIERRPRYSASSIHKFVLHRIMQENEGKDERDKLAFPSYRTICKMRRQAMAHRRAYMRHGKRSAYGADLHVKGGHLPKSRKTERRSRNDGKKKDNHLILVRAPLGKSGIAERFLPGNSESPLPRWRQTRHGKRETIVELNGKKEEYKC